MKISFEMKRCEKLRVTKAECLSKSLNYRSFINSVVIWYALGLSLQEWLPRLFQSDIYFVKNVPSFNNTEILFPRKIVYKKGSELFIINLETSLFHFNH